jgi:hypothetical protein
MRPLILFVLLVGIGLKSFGQERFIKRAYDAIQKENWSLAESNLGSYESKEGKKPELYFLRHQILVRTATNPAAFDTAKQLLELAVAGFNTLSVKNQEEWAGANLVVTGDILRKEQLNTNYPHDLVVLTKHWRELQDSQLCMLKGLCVNTSISALDSKNQIHHRLYWYNKLKKYCISVLRVNTADFNNIRLKNIQNKLLNNNKKELINKIDNLTSINKNISDEIKILFFISNNSDLLILEIFSISWFNCS